MSLEYEPSSEPLHSSAEQFFSRRPHMCTGGGKPERFSPAAGARGRAVSKSVARTRDLREKAWQRRVPLQGRRPSAAMRRLLPSLGKLSLENVTFTERLLETAS